MIFQILWKKWKIELAEPCTDPLPMLQASRPWSTF